MHINAMNSNGMILKVTAHLQVNGLHPMGCTQFRLRFDGSSELFTKRNRSGDTGS